MSALATAALLVAFVFAWGLSSTQYADLAPYVDPAVLALLSLAMIPIPVRTVRQALSEILLMTPSDLDAEVRARRWTRSWPDTASPATRATRPRSGVGSSSRSTSSSPRTGSVGTVADLDAVRDEIAAALGADGPDAWLTVDFTGSEPGRDGAGWDPADWHGLYSDLLRPSLLVTVQ